MAVAQIELNNPNNAFWINLYNKTIAPLWYGIKQWFGVAAITSGILYANALFNMQHGIFPVSISIAVACGVAWTYLSGLAYVAATEKAGWSTHAMIFAGALTDCLFGMLYVLGKYGVIASNPDDTTATQLAVAHVIPLIILVIIFTYCKRLYLTEQATKKARATERIEHWKDEKLKIEVEREKLALERDRQKLQSVSNKTCDYCQHALSQAQFAAMKRYKRCRYCMPS